MSILVVVTYVVAVLFAVLVLVRLASVAVAMLRPGQRRWVDRSGRDRRQRRTSVALDRRCEPRRQDDLATEFLSQTEHQSSVFSAARAES